MSNKEKKGGWITLLQGEKILSQPGKKVIDAHLFSEVIQGEKLIELIQEQGKKNFEQAERECVELKKQAEKQGFEKGYAKWAEKIVELENEIQRVRGEVEKQVTQVALKAARKIVDREMELHPDVVVDIVRKHLKAVAQHKKVIIYVNRQEFAEIESARNELKKMFEQLETFSVRVKDDLSRGSCVIETEGGIINAQIENQWATLEKAFALLEKQKEKKE